VAVTAISSNHRGARDGIILETSIEARRHPVPDLRLQGQACPRQHPRLRRLHRDRHVRRRGGRRGGLQPRRRTREQRVDARARARFEQLFGRKLGAEYVDQPRRGDHICYISDPAALPRRLSRLGA